jgi:hypothetical protein
MKVRRTKIGVYHCEADTSWANTQLKFIDQTGDDRKEVWIHIERPSDVDYIREQLNKIVDSWHKQLQSMHN